MTNYTPEQLSKIYKQLPAEIKEWICSDETFEAIVKVLDDNQIHDEKAGQASNLIRDVLYGLLMPESFTETLKKEVGLEEAEAKKVGQEINRLVFFPIKEALRQLYEAPAKAEDSAPAEESAKPANEVKTTSGKPDTYRESFE